MKTILLTSVGLILATTAQAATGSATFDFEFTSFSGSFAWSDSSTPNDSTTYLGAGKVNGNDPLYDGTHADRNLDGSQWIIGGIAPLSGATATMVASTFPDIPNIVSFTPVANSGVVSTGESFKLGTLSFTNGAWFGGVGNLPVNLNFQITSSSATPEFNNQIWNASFVMVTNVASGSCSDPTVQANNADFVYASGAQFMGSLRVSEPFCSPNPSQTQTGSADIWASFGSLDPDSFRNPQGDAFLSASTDIGPLGGVPEPSTWAMMIIGLAGLASLRLSARRRACKI